MTSAQISEFYHQQIEKISRPHPSGWAKARCPFHDDRTASLSIHLETGGWKCHAACGKGTIYHFAEKKGVILPIKKDTVKTFDYGHYKKKLYDDKSFHYVQNIAGKEVYNLQGVKRELYKISEALKHERIFFVEGEKCADYLWNEGFAATTSGGADSWDSSFSHFFDGKDVVIWPDNDEPGKELAKNVAVSLNNPKSVIVIDMPNLCVGGDVEDYFLMGGTKESLTDLISNHFRFTYQLIADQVKFIEDKCPQINSDLMWRRIKDERPKIANKIFEIRDKIDEEYARFKKNKSTLQEINKRLKDYENVLRTLDFAFQS